MDVEDRKHKIENTMGDNGKSEVNVIEGNTETGTQAIALRKIIS